jgi:hypothetical protein
MKSSKARRDDRFLNEIVETLRAMPTRRLRIVRDIGGIAPTTCPGALGFWIASLRRRPDESTV